MYARVNPRLDDRAKSGDHALLICPHEIYAGGEPERKSNRRRPASPGAPRLLNSRHLRRRRQLQRRNAHRIPASPRIKTLSSSESELRIAVVLSSRIFLYDSSVRSSL